MTVNSFPGARKKKSKYNAKKILLKQPILQLRYFKTFYVEIYYELYETTKKKKSNKKLMSILQCSTG